MLPQIDELISLVSTIAREELLPRLTRVDRQFKKDGSIVTEADLAVQSRLERQLLERWPDIPILGEEMSDEQQQHALESSTSGLWVLDPLDGTSNFAAAIPYFSVSLALLVKGVPELGMVYDPVRDECFYAIREGGAFLNGVVLSPPVSGGRLNSSIGIVDLKRLEPDMATRLVCNPPYASQRGFGSVALEWCYLAAGRGHVYLHGRMKIWDMAAGWLILKEAGGFSTTIEGEEVYSPDLQPKSAVAAMDEALFHEWCAVLGVPNL